MDVTIHAGVKTLIGGHACQQLGIEHDLVENRVVRVYAEFLFRSGQDCGAGDFGAGTGQSRDRQVIYGRILDKVPALIVRR